MEHLEFEDFYQESRDACLRAEPSDPSQNLEADFKKVVREERQPGTTPDGQQLKEEKQPTTGEDAQQEKQLEAGKDPAQENQHNGIPTIVITPSAMPQGTKLIIGMRTPGYQPDSPSRVAVSMGLVPDDAPLTCTTDVPAAPPTS
ncbi:hypothetical protein GCM10009555_088130 [Acrocarpospora macrocephala]|uniref:Uncharacterized protein n=1 Tax=Acrocarpospora macrocephala TaxID=150177 RepID=A0A5M3X811_9ACTN|nr:hypothetical protein Amac_103840 [Acrocarpospora macrocephala]